MTGSYRDGIDYAVKECIDVRQMVLHDEECAWVTDAADPCDCHADAAVNKLILRLDNAERAIKAVREMHQPKTDGSLSMVQHAYCSCGTMETFVASDGYLSIGPAPHPCATLRALDAALTPTTEGT